MLWCDCCLMVEYRSVEREDRESSEKVDEDDFLYCDVPRKSLWRLTDIREIVQFSRAVVVFESWFTDFSSLQPDDGSILHQHKNIHFVVAKLKWIHYWQWKERCVNEVGVIGQVLKQRWWGFLAVCSHPTDQLVSIRHSSTSDIVYVPRRMNIVWYIVARRKEQGCLNNSYGVLPKLFHQTRSQSRLLTNIVFSLLKRRQLLNTSHLRINLNDITKANDRYLGCPFMGAMSLVSWQYTNRTYTPPLDPTSATPIITVGDLYIRLLDDVTLRFPASHRVRVFDLIACLSIRPDHRGRWRRSSLCQVRRLPGLAQGT